MPEPRHPWVNGIFLMLGASFAFAAMAAATKAISKSVPAAEIVFVRSLAGSLLIALWMMKERVSWRAKEPRMLLARGVIGFTAMILYFWCLTQMDLGTAVMLNYTAPISAVLGSALLFKEKLSRTTKIAVLLAFAGVYLLSAPQFHFRPLPLLAGFLSGLLAGVVHVLIRQSHKEELPLMIILYFTVISTIGSGLLLLKTGVWPLSGVDSLLLAAVTATSLIGQIALTYSLRLAPVAVVSPFGNITPVLGLLIGAWLWGETLTPMAMAGGVLIVFCGIFLYRHHTSAL